MTSPTSEQVKKRKKSPKEGTSDRKRAKEEQKEAKREKKRRKREKKRHPEESHRDPPTVNERHVQATASSSGPNASELPLHKYVLAPMVGASELAFRLLCRKYGAQLAYTPMMFSSRFANDDAYRKSEFQTIPEDRPLVCHFSANDPSEFARAAKLCESCCDAIDLNLGCPQRTAYVGHFGSYLLDEKDRELVLRIVRAGKEAVSIPIFVKIRLLDTLEETVTLCRQLRDAGASLVAIHARYRASFERKGPGARDGPAMLDQVAAVKQAVPDMPIIANGNVVTYEHVVENLKFTGADGVMTAEGILDNPALFLPRLGSREDSDRTVVTADPSPLLEHTGENEAITAKKIRKLTKKLRQIDEIDHLVKANGDEGINDEQREKLAKKSEWEMQLRQIRATVGKESLEESANGRSARAMTVTLGELYAAADNPLKLANEYMLLVRRYPVKLRSVVFHVRRILKDQLNRFQLMEECVACETVDQVQAVLDRCGKYHRLPDSFIFDRAKAARQKEAMERKRREEGKRKAFEARMIRKAKREGKSDLEFYLRIGAEVPTPAVLGRLESLSREKQLELWKQNHSQHCLAFHLDPGGCKRDRACAFLHSDAKGKNTFVESDEVAG